MSDTTKSLGTQALNTAGGLVGTAHQQAHAIAPQVVPAPGGGAQAGVDGSSDLEPQSPTDRAKLDKLYGQRSSPEELKEKGILKGGLGFAFFYRSAMCGRVAR